MIEPLIDILINRDGLSRSDAVELINELRARVSEGEDPEELLHDELGLEPDYIWELLD